MNPDFKSPKFVLLKVSVVMSALKILFEKLEIVKQVPLTATLSPNFKSSKILFASIVITLLFIDLTIPISSIIPVNIFIFP